MAKLAITIAPRIVKGGGAITKDVYKSHATQTWSKGAILILTSGLLTPVVDTSSGAAEIDTDDTGTSGAHLFFALSDHLTAGSVFVPVQAITADTVIEMQLCATGSTNPTYANVVIGAKYVGYQLDGGTMDGCPLVGLDVDDTTTPLFEVVETEQNYSPWDPTGDDDYAKVWVKVSKPVLA